MEAGQTIAGKYRLNRLLGTGGMASVWSATNVFTEREFAIKFMLPQVARTPEAARRFLLEAKVSARINHPNIIEVIDVGQAEDGSLFLVMELLSGCSLDVAVRRRDPPMSVHEFMVNMRDVAVALAAAHRSGVVHRDLKPTNIFLHHKDRDGRMVPKILDFGVSKILEEEANTSLTVVGTVLGSPLYMSPEQAMGAAGIDGRTDVFAFGGILFESLTAHRAFDAPNFNALIVTIATKQPKQIDLVAPDLPESLRALVRDCLVTDKEKRLASFDLVAERIEAMLQELTTVSNPLPSPYTERPSDPDATNALPQIRASGKTPLTLSAPATTSPAKRESTPPSPRSPQPLTGTQAPPPASPGRTALAWLTSAETYVKKLPPRALVVVMGSSGLVVLALIVVGLAAAFSRGGGPRSNAAIQGSAVAAATGTATVTASSSAWTEPAKVGQTNIPSADESAEPPVISVESLPVAGHGAPAKGNGRLSVVAKPGWCSISVDGVQRGVTPLTSVELPAGPHRVDCVSPTGQTRTASVSLAEGTATHYRFALDE